MRGFFASSELRQVKPPVSLVPKCGACQLFKHCQTPYMKWHGQGKRGILLLGEAPGKNEDEQGRQFVGKAGQRLQKALRKFGVDMEVDCWTYNALSCRPQKNRTPNDNEIDYCRANVINTLKELAPTTIIPLGGVATKSLLGHVWKEDDFGGMERWAGWQIPSHKPNAWICPNFHPSYVVRCENSYDNEPPKPQVGVLFETYLGRALKLSGRPWESVPDYSDAVHVMLDTEAAARCIRKYIDKGGLQAVDIESTCLKPTADCAEIICCSVSDGHVSFAFPWAGPVIPAMKEWVQAPMPKVAANMQFEENWFWRFLGSGARNWKVDTVLAAHHADVRPGICSIKFQAYCLLGAPSWNYHLEEFLKADGPSKPNRIKQISITDLLRYCALDSLYEIEVAKRQIKLGGL